MTQPREEICVGRRDFLFFSQQLMKGPGTFFFSPGPIPFSLIESNDPAPGVNLCWWPDFLLFFSTIDEMSAYLYNTTATVY